MTGIGIGFFVGVATGVALAQFNRRCVERAVQAERHESLQEIDRIAREKNQMQQRYESQLRDRDSRISYQRGMEVGKRDGMNASNSERLEHALQGESGKRTVQIGSHRADTERRMKQ